LKEMREAIEGWVRETIAAWWQFDPT